MKELSKSTKIALGFAGILIITSLVIIFLGALNGSNNNNETIQTPTQQNFGGF